MYETYIFGGSIGEINSEKKRGVKTKFSSGVGTGRLYGTYPTKVEVQVAGRQYVASFSGGHRNYYHPRFRVSEVTKPRMSHEDKEKLQLDEFALDRFGKRFKDLSLSEQGQVIEMVDTLNSS